MLSQPLPDGKMTGDILRDATHVRSLQERGQIMRAQTWETILRLTHGDAAWDQAWATVTERYLVNE